MCLFSVCMLFSCFRVLQDFKFILLEKPDVCFLAFSSFLEVKGKEKDVRTVKVGFRRDYTTPRKGFL